MTQRTKKLLLNIVKIILVVGVFYFICKYMGASWEQIKDYDYSSVRWLIIFIAFILLIIGYILFGIMWVLIINGHREKISVIDGCGVFFLANLFRYIPGKVWQGLSMIYLSSKKGITYRTAISSTIIHQIVFIISGLTVSILLLPTSALGTDLSFLSYGRFLAFLLFLFVYPPILNFIISLFSKLLKKEIEPIDLSFGKLILYWLWGILVWLVDGVALAMFVFAFHAISFLNLLSVVAIFPTGYIAGFLAIIFPGGIGIREGVFAILLKAIAPPPLNITIAVLSRVWIMAMEIIVAFPFLIHYTIIRNKEKNSK